jgi:hypothetical protein
MNSERTPKTSIKDKKILPSDNVVCMLLNEGCYVKCMMRNFYNNGGSLRSNHNWCCSNCTGQETIIANDFYCSLLYIFALVSENEYLII